MREETSAGRSYVKVAEKASAGYAVLFASFKSRDWKRIKLSVWSDRHDVKGNGGTH